MFFFFIMIQFSCNKSLDDDGDGFDELSNDCDDNNPDIHPDAIEQCDGIDNNCNREIDELGATGGRIWYIDLDRDGYGDAGQTIEACTQPEGYAENKWDCNESDPNVNPGMDEICDGIDNDCDGETDEDSAIDALLWFPDYDGDGFGNDDLVKSSCVQPIDYLETGGDCNDYDPLIHPSQLESCETDVDDNCDGEANEDDAIGCMTWYADLDGDGYPGSERCICESEEPYVHTEGNDCNDENAVVYPGSTTEDVGWNDNDCSGSNVRWLDTAEYRYEYAETPSSSHTSNIIHFVQSSDVDGDTIPDIVLSYDNGSMEPGTIIVQTGVEHDQVHDIWSAPSAQIQGTLSSPLSTNAVLNSIGFHPAVLDDFNEDGIDDVVVAHTTSSQTVELFWFWGPIEGERTLEQADATHEQAFLYDHRINMFAMKEGEQAALLLVDPHATDFSNATTGKFDVLQWNSNSNQLEVVRSVYGAEHEQYMGSSGGNAGDVNGDGLEDEVILTETTKTMDPFGQLVSSKSGSIDLYYGEYQFPDVTIVSNIFYERIANQFAGAGDYNGDGYADLAFSASESHVYKRDAGRTQIVWGPLEEGNVDLTDLHPLVLTGFTEGMVAECPQAVGDIDGDGNDELLIGANMQPWNSSAQDGAFLWFGNHADGTHQLDQGTTAILSDGNSYRPSGSCEAGVRLKSGVGDIDQDGFDDFIIAGNSTTTDSDMRDGLWLFMGMER